MTAHVDRFYNSIEDANTKAQRELIELFVYYLTVEVGQETATPKQVADCFVECDLTVPANVGARLNEGAKKKAGKPSQFLKSGSGYKLHRHRREELSSELGEGRASVQTSVTLRELERKLPEGTDKDFLTEAIDCFEAGANRATIVMAWILAMDHLFSYILANKLAEFNDVLAKNTDKRVKVTEIKQRDDFTEMPESKFIEFCRSAKIISNDVRKILDQKLGTRNSCAHPSGVFIGKSKVVDFVEDLVENVILKY